MNHLRPVLDTALDAVVVMNPDGSVADWNGRAEAVFGWLREEAIGRPMADLIVPERLREAHWRGLRSYLETGKGMILGNRIEVPAVRKDGREIPVELAITPTDADGGLLFVGFLRDITQRRRAEETLARRAREAELMFQVTALAAETDSFEDALRTCLAAVCDLTGWPLGHAFLVTDPASPNLAATNLWHQQGEATHSALRAATARTRFEPGVGLPGRILATGEPQWVADVAEDPGFVRGQGVDDLGIKAAFGFPIKSRGQVIAVLEFFSATRADPDPDLMTAVRTMGEQVGRVLERKKLDEQQRLLVDELNHRVKNTLATVQSLAVQTVRSSGSIADFEPIFMARLSALARAHDLLTEKLWRGADLETLIRQTLAPYADREGRVTVTGPAISLNPNAAVTVNLALHELATNAAKYGAFSSETGRLDVRWVVDPVRRALEFEWRESGLADVPSPTRQGFGTRLLKAVARELGAEVTPEHRPEGLGFRWLVPLSEKVSAEESRQES
ncbi:MAG: PAS domain S-box protein [Pseudomonadota bacterium]|nr:PAS domain S-box protein [Pseudomonadota bacterium]